MAITYPLTLPTITGVQSVNFIARNSVGTTASPFTYEQQVFKNVGQSFDYTILSIQEWNDVFFKDYYTPGLKYLYNGKERLFFH